MNLQAPTHQPICVLPVHSRSKTELHVYFGYPDQQPWLPEAVAQATQAGDANSMAVLLEMGAVGLGAPLGTYMDESMRVARATGVFIEKADGLAQSVGGALAHARTWAYWREAEDGQVLVLEFQAPLAFGWGAGKDTMSQEQLRGACLNQMRGQAESLLENVADPLDAARLEVVFTGRWDESMDVLRARLQGLALSTWQRVLSAEAPDAETAAAEPAQLH